MPSGREAGSQPGPQAATTGGRGRVLATAFHPEMTGDRRVHKLFVDMVTRFV